MGAAEAVPGPESPYKNLLVPLVVVPALIVMVLVLVFVLFGAVVFVAMNLLVDISYHYLDPRVRVKSES